MSSFANHPFPKIAKPYLLFLGDATDALDLKTASGLLHWRPEWCAGQLRLTADTIDLGLPDLSIEEAQARGITSLALGVSPLGGQISPEWLPSLECALKSNMTIVSGLHESLRKHEAIARQLEAGYGRLVDLRSHNIELPHGTLRKRTGKRCLLVGSDCCVGKMFSALALERALLARGIDASFCATGQTGMMIAENGLCIDAVVADFISGAAQLIAPDAPQDSWQIIEGQGSLFHPSFAGVTLGLVHGAQPDALVFCHIAGQEVVEDFPDLPYPPISYMLEAYLAAARLTNPAARFIGASVNTSRLPANRREDYLHQLSLQIGGPAVDPVAGTVEPLIDALLRAN